jgi:hypothetical protein
MKPSMKHAVKTVSALFVGGLLFLGDGTARADTPAQVQQALRLVCDRSAASYSRRDLAGYMAMYAPNCIITSASGKSATFLQFQAGTAREIAGKTMGVTRYTVQYVTVQGDRAQARITRHFVKHFPTHKPAYTFTYDVVENASWIKQPTGWRMTAVQMLRDVQTYQRN